MSRTIEEVRAYVDECIARAESDRHPAAVAEIAQLPPAIKSYAEGVGDGMFEALCQVRAYIDCKQVGRVLSRPTGGTL